MKTNRRTFIQQSAFLGIGVSLGSKEVLAISEESSSQDTMTDIFKVIENRRSVRSFKSTPVPKEHLSKILKAANFAPSPRNRQDWKFLVIQDRKIIDQIKDECIKMAGENSKQYFTDYLSAPVYVVVLANEKTRNPANDITAGALATENLMLAARALGYGTVYCANSIPEDITKKVLNIPDGYKRLCITPIGVPSEWPETPQKKSLEEVVLYDKFS